MAPVAQVADQFLLEGVGELVEEAADVGRVEGRAAPVLVAVGPLRELRASLALAGVEFEDYLPASVVAVLRPSSPTSSWAAPSPSFRRREATRRRRS